MVAGAVSSNRKRARVEDRHQRNGEVRTSRERRHGESSKSSRDSRREERRWREK